MGCVQLADLLLGQHLLLEHTGVVLRQQVGHLLAALHLPNREAIPRKKSAFIWTHALYFSKVPGTPKFNKISVILENDQFFVIF